MIAKAIALSGMTVPRNVAGLHPKIAVVSVQEMAVAARKDAPRWKRATSRRQHGWTMAAVRSRLAGASVPARRHSYQRRIPLALRQVLLLYPVVGLTKRTLSVAKV